MSRLSRVFAALAIAWVILLPLAAFAASRPLPEVGTAMAVVVYRIGSLVCHQRPERSFHVFGVALPVCARCTGIYTGAALMAVAATVRAADARRPSTRTAADVRRAADAWTATRKVGDARRFLLLAALPTAATLVYEWSTGQMPTHWIRAMSGVPLGAVVAWIVCIVAPARSEVM
jgi:Predicted membrane protein (DUF2085)